MWLVLKAEPCRLYFGLWSSGCPAPLKVDQLHPLAVRMRPSGFVLWRERFHLVLLSGADGSQRFPRRLPPMPVSPSPGWSEKGCSLEHLHIGAGDGAGTAPPALPYIQATATSVARCAHRSLPGKLMEEGKGRPRDGLHGPARHRDIAGFSRVHHGVVDATRTCVPVVMEAGKKSHQ